MVPESTRQLVAALRTEHRNALWRGGCAAAVSALGFALVVSLANARAGDPRPPLVVPENVDLVAYTLPAPRSVNQLAEELWQGEVNGLEVLRYNRDLTDPSATLPAGTVVTVPNFRDFPVEALSARARADD